MLSITFSHLAVSRYPDFIAKISKIKDLNDTLLITISLISTYLLYLSNRYIARAASAIHPAMFSQTLGGDEQTRVQFSRATTSSCEMRSRQCDTVSVQRPMHNVRRDANVGVPTLYNDTEWINPTGRRDAMATRSGIIDMLFLCFAYS